MPTLLAVSLSKDLVAFASIRCERDSRPCLESLLEVNRAEFEAATVPSEEPSMVPGMFNVPERVTEFITKVKFSDVVCLFEPPRFFSELLTFPFDSSSKVEQVAPLELEEALPFEIENYIIDPFLLERSDSELPSSEREFLVVGVEAQAVKTELEFLRFIGLDPVLFVPKISALSAIAKFLPEEEVLGGVAFVSIGDKRLLFSLSRNSQPILQRDIETSSDEKAMAEVLPTLLSASRILPPNKIYFVGESFELNLKGIKNKTISFGDLNFEIPNRKILPSLDNLGMLALAAIRVKKLPTINFRKGNYRYRGNLKSYLEPFLEDKSYVLTLLGALVAWITIAAYSTASEMSVLDTKAQELISTAFPNEVVAKGSELNFVNDKLQNLESTMKGLGNISSLSPLEALTELSEVIPSGVDVAIDSLSTTQVGDQYGGRHGGNGRVGKLIGALQKKQNKERSFVR
jgi:hypothetical protein